jgi:hypothetical protein
VATYLTRSADGRHQLLILRGYVGRIRLAEAPAIQLGSGLVGQMMDETILPWRPQMRVTHDLPYANGHVLSINGEHLVLLPEQPEIKADQDWFFWAVRVFPDGADRIVLSFGKRHCLTAQGPAISLDNGRTWRWLGRQRDGSKQADDRCEVPVPSGVESMILSMCIPYQLPQWEAFVAQLPADRIVLSELTRSTAGRPVPLLRAGAGEDGHILLTARHHACEVSGSHVLEGIVAAMLCDDTWAPWLRQHRLSVVPFVDTDGVATGQQGKMRAPHDHNGDYQDGRYPEIRALRDLALSHGPMVAAIDLHSPWIRDYEPRSWNEQVYQVGSAHAANAREQQRFQGLLAASAANTAGSLPLLPDDLLPHGQAWNSGPLEPARSCTRWMAVHGNARLSTTIETAYAEVSGTATSIDSFRATGRAIAAALWHYLSH